MEKVNLVAALAGIAEHWRPKVVARLNGQEVKLVKFEGEFVWHRHADADELFLALEGTFRVEFRDGAVPLQPGEILVVPRGVEHRTVAEREAAALLFEPTGTRNTGDVLHQRFTAPSSETP
jgi:mannose-6-phosphate isomerase-like protein (cupin superfamily)